MNIKRLILVGAAAIGIGINAIAGATDATVVAVHYSVRANSATKLEIISDQVERSVQNLERLAKMASTTSHGVVDIEIGFQGKTTTQDLAAVTTQLDTLKFGEDVVVLSRVIELRPPRLLAGPWSTSANGGRTTESK